MRRGRIFICGGHDYKPGDMPPTERLDYLGWHDWPEVQRKAGVLQSRCKKCEKWLTPQEVKQQMETVHG